MKTIKLKNGTKHKGKITMLNQKMYKGEILDLIKTSKTNNLTYLIQSGYCNPHKSVYLHKGKLAYINGVFNTNYCFEYYKATKASIKKDCEYIVTCINTMKQSYLYGV